MRRPPPGLVERGQSEAELNKRLLAGLGERRVYEVSMRSRSDNSLVVCRDLWIEWQSRLSVVTLGCEDSKSTSKDKKSKRSNEKSGSSSRGSGGSRNAAAVERTAAGKEEQDDWKPVGKARNLMLMLSRNAKKQLPNSFHVRVIISLLGWLPPSLEVCWCPTGSVRL